VNPNRFKRCNPSDSRHYRIEGRDYVVHDGDLLLFRFSV
jgi:ribosome-binding ATPase YchF (GTP1/OBG family)